jgi:catechol 2,3-dioxygenase-like lactoylglutathione lyase family enzyme
LAGVKHIETHTLAILREVHEMPEYKFAHVHLISQDPLKTAEFYENVLGAKREGVRKTSDGATNVDLELGGTKLLIRQPRPKPLQQLDSSTECILEHIGLFTNDFDAAVNDLKAKGIKFVQEIKQLPTHRVTFFIAPENVLVELMEPHK